MSKLLFDEIVDGARVMKVTFKAAKEVISTAHKINESQQVQELKTNLKSQVKNSEALNNVKQAVGKKMESVLLSKDAKCCPNCKTKLSSDALFCSNCGTKL